MVKKSCRKCKKNSKRKCSCNKTHKGDHISHGSSKVSVRVIVPQQASAPAQLPDFGVYQEQNRLSFAEIHQLIKKIEPTSISNAIKNPIGKVEQQTQTTIPNIMISKGKEKVIDSRTPSPVTRSRSESPRVDTRRQTPVRDLVRNLEQSSSSEQTFYHPVNRITIKHGGNAYNDLMDEGHRLQLASPERSKLGMPLEDYRAHFRQYHTQREYPATQPF